MQIKHKREIDILIKSSIFQINVFHNDLYQLYQKCQLLKRLVYFDENFLKSCIIVLF